MIPSEFEYYRANSINEAIKLMAEKGPDAKLLAGGHSLLPAMRLRFDSPAVIIDTGSIPDFDYIREQDGELLIGAGTTHAELAASGLVSSKIPMISEAAASIGDLQVRNKGTIGGSIAHADPAADWPAALLAADAEIVIANDSGTRVVPASSFFLGLFYTDLAEAEMIVEIKVPVPPPNTRSTYLKFKQPASRFAIVGCAASVTQGNATCERVRVAFNGVSSTPFRDQAVERALEGNAADQGSIEAAAEHAAVGVDVMSDHFASTEYRSHLAKVFAKRALAAVTV